MKHPRPRHLLWPLALLLLGGALTHPTALAAQDADTLRLAVLRNHPPLYQTGDQGQPTGFIPEVLQAVLARAGFRPAWVPVDDWTGLVAALTKGRADLALIPPSPERLWILSFGAPLLTSHMALLTRSEGSGIRGPADLAHKTVAFMQGGIVPPLIMNLPGVRVVRSPSVEQAIFALLAGEVDAVATGKLELQHAVRLADLGHLVRFQSGPEFEYKRCLAVAKGREALLARLDPLGPGPDPGAGLQGPCGALVRRSPALLDGPAPGPGPGGGSSPWPWPCSGSSTTAPCSATTSACPAAWPRPRPRARP